MMQDRITIRFKDPKDLKALKELAEMKNIKLNKLVTKILIEAKDHMLDPDVEMWRNYLEGMKELKN